MLALYVLYEVVPTCSLGIVAGERNHRKRLALLRIAGTYVGAVAASETVENARLYDEVHTLHCGWSLHLDGSAVEAFKFFVSQNERTDGSVRTNVSTLVALDTVFGVPFRNKCLDTALLISRRAVLPCAVYSIVFDEV